MAFAIFRSWPLFFCTFKIKNQRNWVFVTNSNCLIPISFSNHNVNLSYLILQNSQFEISMVYNIGLQRYKEFVAKNKFLYNMLLEQIWTCFSVFSKPCPTTETWNLIKTLINCVLCKEINLKTALLRLFSFSRNQLHTCL